MYNNEVDTATSELWPLVGSASQQASMNQSEVAALGVELSYCDNL